MYPANVRVKAVAVKAALKPTTKAWVGWLGSTTPRGRSPTSVRLYVTGTRAPDSN